MKQLKGLDTKAETDEHTKFSDTVVNRKEQESGLQRQSAVIEI